MPTLGVQTVDRLRDDIISGSLPPGAMIRDAAIAAKLGISTIPLREALVQLAAEGLVELVPNRYRRVAPLSKRKLLELHSVFQILSFAAYAQGVARLTPADIEHMERAVEAQSRAVAARDWVQYVKAGLRANAVVYAASGNHELERMLARLSNTFARVSILVRPAADRLANNKLQHRILDALRGGRRERAVELFRRMVSTLYDLVARLPDDAPVAAPAVRQRRKLRRSK
jgi:DNA-binding GntR family transcriptional regulator